MKNNTKNKTWNCNECIYFYTVFCLREISEASAKESKTLSGYQITIGIAFSVFANFIIFLVYLGKGTKRTADVPNFLWSFTIIQGGASAVDYVLFCSHIHKFFSFVRVTEYSMWIVLPGRWWSNNEALWLSSVGTSYLPHWVGGTISSKSNYLCRTCWLHWVSTPWHKECLLNFRDFKRSPFTANFTF